METTVRKTQSSGHRRELDRTGVGSPVSPCAQARRVKAKKMLHPEAFRLELVGLRARYRMQIDM